MKRTTTTMLEERVNYLNTLTAKNNFSLNFAYEGVRLCELDEHGGQRELSERVSYKEMARILDAAINILSII